jgi:hypothetical protein
VQYPQQYPVQYPQQYPVQYPQQYPAPYPQPYPGQYPGQYPYGQQDPITAMVGAVAGIIQMFKGNDHHNNRRGRDC